MIPYASFCNEYPGAMFRAQGEPDYSIKAQSNPTEEDDELFRDDDTEKKEDEKEDVNEGRVPGSD